MRYPTAREICLLGVGSGMGGDWGAPAGPTTRRDFATAHPPQTIAEPIILDRAPIRDRNHIQFTPTMPNASPGDSAIVWDGGPTLNTVALPDRDPIHLALRPLEGGGGKPKFASPKTSSQSQVTSSMSISPLCGEVLTFPLWGRFRRGWGAILAL